MEFFVFAGAMLFCLFIILCMESMLTYKSSIKETIIYIATLLMAFGIVWLLGLENYLIYISVGSLVLVYGFLSKNVLASILLLVYGGALFVGLSSAITLFTRVFGAQEGLIADNEAIIIVLVLLSMTFLLRRFIKKRIDMNLFNHRIIHLLIIISSVALGIIYINTAEELPYLLSEWAVNIPIIGNILFLICFGVLFAFTLRSVSKETKLRTEMLIAQSSKKYIQDLEESYKALRTLKHDYVNIMASMKLHIDKGDVGGLTKYFYNELSELNEDLLHQDKVIGALHNVEIDEVKSILVYKCSVAAQQQVEIDIEVREPIETVGVSTAILCQMLGILVDNAIDATVETENKKLGIAIIKNPNSKVFIIKNTWTKQNIFINKLFDEGYSIKGKGRGMGLSTIRNYTNKIDRLYIETDFDDEYFTQILSVKDDE